MERGTGGVEQSDVVLQLFVLLHPKAGLQIRIIEAAQDPDSQGYAYLDLSDVLGYAGRPADAIVAAETAVARFELKGNSSSAGRARAAADVLRAAAALPG